MTPYSSSQPQQLPHLAEGVTVALLRRVWAATPEDRRHQRTTLLDSIVTVSAGGHVYAKPLRDLSLAEVEVRIGAVTPRFFVRFYEHGKKGIQFRTFVNEADAAAFASTARLYGEPAKVQRIAGSIR
jgi:hypothetical protein